MKRNVIFIVIAIFLAMNFLIVGGGILWYINTRNDIVRLDETINLAEAEINNQLQRRSDLIPNLVNTVRGYAAHEHQVFADIADARARLAGATTMEERSASSGEMESALSRLLVVVENYPALQANRNFIALQDELAGTENRLAVARRRYNESVGTFNVRIRAFPGSIVAGQMGFDRRAFFEISDEAREAPVVVFN